MSKKKWLAIGSILLVCFGIFLFQPNETKAAGSTEGVINWFKARQGKVTYSMYNRNGPSSYDCSSAVYYALIEAGFLPKGTTIGNTESLYALEGKLLTPISRAEVKRGDIFVSGSKGGSSGGNGHTGVFTSNSTIIHCNYGNNGIAETSASGGWMGGPPTYYYRLKGAAINLPYSNLNKYVMLTKSGTSFYGNLECTSKKGQTVKDTIYYVQRSYKLPNGKSIYSVYTDSAAKNWLGYLKESDNAAKIATMATEINKTVMVNRENKTIDTLPWGQKGYKNVGRSTSYTGKVVTLTQDLGSYAYSPELKGWIDKKGITSVIAVNVAGTIQKGGFSIDPMPWYEGIKHSGATKDHIGKKVTVTARSGSYYYVANLGWIDKKAFNPELQKKVDAEKSKDVMTKKVLPYGEVNKTVMVNRENKTIDTLPWGQKGYKNVSRSTSYTGKVVTITQETYSYAYSPELKGWIDKKGITAVVAVNVAGTIQKGGFSIDPMPWYEGIKHSGATKDHIGEKVTVTARNGSYYYVAKLGWIDKKAFNPELQKLVDAKK